MLLALEAYVYFTFIGNWACSYFSHSVVSVVIFCSVALCVIPRHSAVPAVSAVHFVLPVCGYGLVLSRRVLYADEANFL